jgi:hypothetical protein
MELGISASLIRKFFVFTSADDASIDGGAHVKIGIFRFPDEALVRPESFRLRSRGNNPDGCDAMSVGGHGLRQLVTRTQYDLPTLEREAISRHCPCSTLPGLDIHDLVWRQEPRAKLLSSSEKSRGESPWGPQQHCCRSLSPRIGIKAEAIIKRASVEISAGQSELFTGTSLLGESAYIKNITRQINQRM